jgi:uncharacterized membrane protein YsdA (DUF1294 family)
MRYHGTVAMHVTADHKRRKEYFGISCIVFVLVFALLPYLSHQRRKRLTPAHKRVWYRY